MDSVVKFLQPYQLHPVVDHFSVALLFTAVLIDLVASTAPNRIWLRYTAVLLMILGALAAGGSYFTGDMEADRIWDALGPARQGSAEAARTARRISRDRLRRARRVANHDPGVRLHGGVARDLSDRRPPGDRDARLLGPSRRRAGVRLRRRHGADGGPQPVPSENASPAAVPTSSGPLPTVSVPTPEASASAAPPPATAAPASSIASPSPASVPTANPSVQPSTALSVPSASM